MNRQEAIEILNDFDKCVRVKADGAYPTKDYIYAVNIAISALEKQIPKKPEWNLQNDAILCPCCDLDLMGGVEIDGEIEPEHCWNCGQAIDWRNEDE